jgi:hypothetical protein
VAEDRVQSQGLVVTVMYLWDPYKEKCLDQLSYYKLLKKDFALWSYLVNKTLYI